MRSDEIKPTAEIVEAIAISSAGMLNWPTMSTAARSWYRSLAWIALESPDPPEDTDND